MQYANKTLRAYQSTPYLKPIVGVPLTLLAAFLYFSPPNFKSAAPPSRLQAASAPASQVVPIDKAALFHLYDVKPGTAVASESVQQEQEGSGVVVAAWHADTPENHRACQSLWLFDRAHERLCKALHKINIVAIRESEAFNGRIAYIPVASTVTLALGDEVAFQRGSTGSDGREAALPKLSRTAQK